MNDASSSAKAYGGTGTCVICNAVRNRAEFHRFSKLRVLRNKWIKSLAESDSEYKELTQKLAENDDRLNIICRYHFAPEHYCRGPSLKMILNKRIAVPTKECRDPMEFHTLLKMEDQWEIDYGGNSAETSADLDSTRDTMNKAYSPVKKAYGSQAICVVCDAVRDRSEFVKFSQFEWIRHKWIGSIAENEDDYKELDVKLAKNPETMNIICRYHFPPEHFYLGPSGNVLLNKNIAVPKKNCRDPVEFHNSFKTEDQSEIDGGVNSEESKSVDLDGSTRETKNRVYFPTKKVRDGNATCVVCNEVRNRVEFHKFSKLEWLRHKWIDSIAENESEYRELEHKLATNLERFNVICRYHFSPEHYYAAPNGKMFLNKNLAVPSKECHEIMAFDKTVKNEDKSEIGGDMNSEASMEADPNSESWEFVVDETTITVHPTVLRVALAASQSNMPANRRYYLTTKDFEDIIEGEKTMRDFDGLLKVKPIASTNMSVGPTRVAQTSTSTASPAPLQMEQPPRKRSKFPNRFTKKKLVYRCKICKGTKLRVVDYRKYGNSHGKNILECSNLNCLATVALVEEPAGITYESPDDSHKNFGWFLWDQNLWMYPSLDLVQDALESGPEAVREQLSRLTTHKNVRVEKSLMVKCPGQRKLVKVI